MYFLCLKNLMASLFILLSLTSCAHQPTSHSKPPRSNKADLVIRNVTIFDSITAKTRPNQSIFISDGIIEDIRPSSPIDTAKQVIEGAGRLASPGLIDAHVHLTHQFFPTRQLQEQDRERLARVYLTHGVTTIADMGQPPGWVPTLARWENTPDAASPDIILVAGALNTAHDWDTNPPAHHVLLSSPEAARQQVRTYNEQGAKRLKLYWKLELPEMAAIINEADTAAMQYFAHIDNGFVSMQDAMLQGVRHFEHFFTLQRSIISPDALMPMIAKDFPFKGPGSLDEWTLSLSLYHHKIEQTPALKAQYNALLQTMIETGSTISTSLNMLAAVTGQTPVFSVFDPKPPRGSPAIRDGFIPEGVGKTAFTTVMTQVRRAHEAGLKFRIGTDARNGGEVTLAEMQLLAEAGLPVGEVLKIATKNGADALGIADKAGYLGIGRTADIVLFNKSPYDHPQYFLAGVTTIKNGQTYVPTRPLSDQYADRLLNEGIEKAGQWWDSQSKKPHHPTEFQHSIQKLFDKGKIAHARILIAILPTMLHGETVTDYVHEEGISRAGSHLLNTGNIDAAIAIFELAIELMPDSWAAYHNLGSAYAEGGQTEKAIAAFNRSLALNPDNAAGKAALENLQMPSDESSRR